ncbi:MAG: 2-oxo acid dehydrogenase subunit E2 [Bacteroidales bacterium]|nr:2-oxo acid dehydrogenase subunit E2 [Bacteroidales bacterium]
MAIPVIMPKQGQSVETCIITRWFKERGEKVATGDILFSYETDKAAFDLESPGDGILLEVFFGEGDEVPVLMNVAVIGKSGESTEQYQPGKTIPSGKVVQDTSKNEELPLADATGIKIVSSSQESRIRISPRAKKLAEERGLTYNNLHGSGPNGRIIFSDVEKALSGNIPGTASISATGTEYTEQPLSNVRKIIARAMHSSLQNSAQLTHHMSADVRRLLDARRKIKDGLASGTEKQDITLNDMVCWCVMRALKKFPDVNIHFLGDTVRTFHKIHLGIAVDTSRGLMVPAIKNADEMDLPRLSAELKSVADACRKGNINPELIQSTAATFTVSNLGSYGVEMFTPVINLPQAGILGVCTIINRPADLGNNTFGFIPFIGLSLTYDHRAIDGGPATLFLKEIKDQIENFNY